MAKKKRRRLERCWKRTGEEVDRRAYRSQCRITNSLINESRRQYYAQRIADMTAGTRKRWTAVNELLHAGRRSFVSDSEAKTQCEAISAYFQQKVSRMKDVITGRLAGLSRNPFQYDKPYSGEPLNLFGQVTVEEVHKLLGEIPSKSSPMDFVSTSVLKKCRGVFAPLLARLANLSFQEGRFPERFKRAQVTPLLKHDGLDSNNPANFRPISNLNTISKVIERLALARLRPHVTKSPNFNTSQSAYRRHHSTETALLSTLNDVYGNIDAGQDTLLVALDLSAAFDTVEHSALLTRLEHSFGIKGPALSWIGSYLTGRTQFVHLGSADSVVTNCHCGVPQGSVLGPLLFIVYISSTANITTNFGVGHHQYADDSQVYVALSRDNMNDRVSNMQNCLTALHQWFSQNGLVINPDKSESVLFSTAQKTSTSPLGLNKVDVAGCSVPLSDSVKILGVTLDRHLTFNAHVQSVCKSAQYHTRALRHIRSSLTMDMARTVASALVNSRLDYANSVLYGTTESNILKLQRAQNALARVVTCSTNRTRSTCAATTSLVTHQAQD